MRRTALAAAVLAASLTACTATSAAEAAKVEGHRAPGIVSGDEAKKLVDEGVKVVDVRTAEEFAAGHVPGAVNIPFDQIGARAAEVGDPKKPVLLYCRSGRRSGIATETLKGLGFTEIYDMKALAAWPGEVER